MTKKYIVTKINKNDSDFLFYGLCNGKEFYEVNLCKEEAAGILGNIYVGRVRDVIPGIQAAFVEYAPGMAGYYSLTDNRRHIFLNKKNSAKVVQGDMLMVQVGKEAVKTKDPVLTSEINLSGKYAAITINKHGIGISAKIRDKKVRESLKTSLEPYLSTEYGIVIRTNGGTAEIADVKKELEQLLSVWERLYQKALTSVQYTLLFKKEADYITRLKGIYENEIGEIVTDLPEVYRAVAEQGQPCTFYEDALLSLKKLYNVEGCINELLDKKVWLKCGGYLIIEYTEAMTVIDVNSGKFSKGKNFEGTILKVNLEAAVEIARQIRLRNLSGMIIIDFISMEQTEMQKQVMDAFEAAIEKDPIKTCVVDMTKLNLLEVTRKKARQPIYEVLKNV